MSCRGTEIDRRELDSYYTDLKKQLSIVDYNNVVFIFNGLDMETAIASLNTFNCLLSINDDHSQYLYEKYMISNGNSIINRYNVENIQIPPIIINESHDIDDTLISISTTDLCQKMKDIQNQQQGSSKYQKSKKNNLKNLGETLCHILQ
jgi:sRNA-binding regulator protein Hfq